MSSIVSDVGIDAIQMHYVTSYSAAELWTFCCERVCKMLLSGLDPSMLIRFLCKTEVDWIGLQCWSLVEACTMKRCTLTAGLVM